MLEPFTTAVSSPGKRAVVVHLMGSHTEYSRRSPPEFKVFSGPVRNLSPDDAATVNEYDNSVYYNDYIVSEIIRRVEALGLDACVLYFSDHGQEVYDFRDVRGQNSSSLSRYMTDIPFLVWLSDPFRSRRPDLVERIAQARNKPFQLPDLSFALAELAGIRFAGWTPERSLFSAEYAAGARTVRGIPYERLRLDAGVDVPPSH